MERPSSRQRPLKSSLHSLQDRNSEDVWTFDNVAGKRYTDKEHVKIPDSDKARTPSIGTLVCDKKSLVYNTNEEEGDDNVDVGFEDVL